MRQVIKLACLLLVGVSLAAPTTYPGNPWHGSVEAPDGTRVTRDSIDPDGTRVTRDFSWEVVRGTRVTKRVPADGEYDLDGTRVTRGGGHGWIDEPNDTLVVRASSSSSNDGPDDPDGIRVNKRIPQDREYDPDGT